MRQKFTTSTEYNNNNSKNNNLQYISVDIIHGFDCGRRRNPHSRDLSYPIFIIYEIYGRVGEITAGIKTLPGHWRNHRTKKKNIMEQTILLPIFLFRHIRQLDAF